VFLEILLVLWLKIGETKAIAKNKFESYNSARV
jgi:hypothetical protein